MMTRSPLAVLAAALTLAASLAQAAEPPARLDQVTGEVMVGGAGGISAAKAGASLKPGDRVVARSGGAVVRFADGCRASLAENAMLTIAERSPCAGGEALVQAGATSAQLGIGEWPAGAWFAGAGVAVIAGAIIYGLSGAVSE